MDALETADTNENLLCPEEIIALMNQQLDQTQEQLAAEDLQCPFYQEWDNEDKNRHIRTRKFSPPKNKNKLFKTTVRSGIDNLHRDNFYLFLSGIDQTYNESRQFWSDVVKINSQPRYGDIVSLFAAPDYELDVPKEYLENLLTIVLNQNKTIEYSPMIPSVASILSLYLKPDVAYFALQSMINQEDKYFTKTKQEFAIMLKTIEHVISSKSKSSLCQHLKTLKLSISEISLFVMPLFFSKKVDKRVSLTIFDAFIYDGRSALMRYVVGILFYLRSRLLATMTANEFMETIHNYITSLHNPTELNELIHFTFSLSFSKSKKVVAIENKLKKELNCSELINVLISPLPKIEDFDTFHQFSPLFNSPISGRHTYHGRLTNTITVNKMINMNSNTNNGQLLSNTQFFNLKQKFPSVFKKFNAYPVYLMSLHGTSMLYFLEKAKKCRISLIVIQTESKSIGAVMECSLKICKKNGHIGGPSTTIFDLSNNSVYKSSLKNSYYVNVSRDSISIGGGSTGCAIYIKEWFSDVISDCCETFDSPSLLDGRQEAVVNIELYSLAV